MMKNNQGFWILLCILIVKVLSSEENETKIIDDDPRNEIFNQPKLTSPMKITKRYIQDGKFTESQKMYVYAMIPVVKQICGHYAPMKHIISLIVDYFKGKPVLPAQHFPKSRAYPHKYYSMMLLSPDSQWIASDTMGDPPNRPYSLFLWNVITGEKQRILLGHTDSISQCVFTSDSQFLISASWDTSLKLWYVLTGELLHTFTGHTARVTSCTLSKDDCFLLSTAKDKTVRRWEIETRTCTHTLRGHTGNVVWGRFFANDQQIVSVCRENVRVWDSESGECVYHLGVDLGDFCEPICTLSSNEQLLLVGCADGWSELNVWKREELVQTFKEHPLPVYSALFVSNDTCIASLDSRGTILIWRWVDGYIINRFEKYNLSYIDSFLKLEYSYWQKKTK